MSNSLSHLLTRFISYSSLIFILYSSLFAENTTQYLKVLNLVNQAELMDNEKHGDPKSITLYNKAKKECLKLVKSSSKPLYIQLLIKITIALGEDPREKSLLELIHSIDPIENAKELSEIHQHIGIYISTYDKDPRAALFEFEKAMDYDQDNLQVAFQATQMAILIGDYRKAKKIIDLLLANQKIEQYPAMSFNAKRSLAQIYLREKSHLKVREIFEEIVYSSFASRQEKWSMFLWLISYDGGRMDFESAQGWIEEMELITELPARVEERKWVYTWLMNPSTSIDYRFDTDVGKKFGEIIAAYEKGDMFLAAGNLLTLGHLDGWQLEILYALYLVSMKDDRLHLEHHRFFLEILTFLQNINSPGLALKLIALSKEAGIQVQSRIYAMEGFFSARTGDRDRAKNSFVQYLENDYVDVTVVREIHQYFQSIKDLDGSIQAASKLAKLEPTNINYSIVLSKLLIRAEQFEQAEQILLKSLESKPLHQVTLEELGHIYHELKQTEKLIETYTKLITHYPLTVNFYNFLGYYYANEGIHLEQADYLLEKGLKLSPNDPAILDSIAWLRFRQEKYPEALAMVRQAIEEMGKTSEIDGVLYFHAGEIYFAMENWQKAKDFFERVLTVSASEKNIPSKARMRLEDLEKQ